MPIICAAAVNKFYYLYGVLRNKDTTNIFRLKVKIFALTRL